MLFVACFSTQLINISMEIFTACMFSILKVLCASMSQKTQPPSRCNVLMLRNRYCKMVARVLCLVAREWVGSCQS